MPLEAYAKLFAACLHNAECRYVKCRGAAQFALFEAIFSRHFFAKNMAAFKRETVALTNENIYWVSN